MHLQRTAGNAGVVQLLGEEPSPVMDVVGRGGGSPLDDSTRGFMESRFGHDFGDVRIHNDSRASDSALAVNAQAYTVGNDIVFQSDRYQPHSSEGQQMIAHELTHVVQQRSGPVSGTPAPGGIQISDPSDSFEREAVATSTNVMAGGPPEAGNPLAAQRQADEMEEEPAVQSLVQRQVEEIEEEPESPAVQSLIQRQVEEIEEEEPPPA
jgi:hypothetical protein